MMDSNKLHASPVETQFISFLIDYKSVVLLCYRKNTKLSTIIYNLLVKDEAWEIGRDDSSVSYVYKQIK